MMVNQWCTSRTVQVLINDYPRASFYIYVIVPPIVVLIVCILGPALERRRARELEREDKAPTGEKRVAQQLVPKQLPSGVWHCRYHLDGKWQTLPDLKLEFDGKENPARISFAGEDNEGPFYIKGSCTSFDNHFDIEFTQTYIRGNFSELFPKNNLYTGKGVWTNIREGIQGQFNSYEFQMWPAIDVCQYNNPNKEKDNGGEAIIGACSKDRVVHELKGRNLDQHQLGGA